VEENKAAITAGLVTAAKATGVILAGIAAFYATSWIRNNIPETGGIFSVADADLLASNGYRAARREAAAKLGRPLTREEVKALYSEFSKRIKENHEFIRVYPPENPFFLK